MSFYSDSTYLTSREIQLFPLLLLEHSSIDSWLSQAAIVRTNPIFTT